MIKKRTNGFSLAEFLLAVTIFMIGIIIAVQVFVTINKNYRILVSYLTSYLKGREMIDIISKDVRIAIRVMDEYGAYTTGDDSLVMKVPSLDASGNILDVNNEFDYVIYKIESENLRKVVIPGGSSSRQASNGVLRKSVGPLFIYSYGTPIADIEHKSSITALTLMLSIGETVLGKEYKITPGTTMKLMNYEWEFVR